MKYTTFRTLALIIGFGALGWGAVSLFSGKPSPTAAPAKTQQPAPVVQTPPPAYQQPAAPPAAQERPITTPVAQQPAAQEPGSRPTTEHLRTRLEGWLAANGDRAGQMMKKDIFPDASYRVNAIRFKPEDAAKFSNDDRQWSQFKIDFDRNGTDDEKWLLKNGHTYKREALANDGKTVTDTSYFDK